MRDELEQKGTKKAKF